MLRFCDGFDHYNTTTQKWEGVNGSQLQIGSTFARTGTAGLNTRGATFISKNVVTSTTLIVGCAFKILDSIYSDLAPIIMFYDAATIQCAVCLRSGGNLSIARGVSVVLGTTTTPPIAPNVWNFIEFKVTFATGATGSAEVRVNGVVVLSLTSIQTAASANASANVVEIGATNVFSYGGFSSANGAAYDDVYICDTTGSLNNTYLGDIQVNAILPNANGTENDFSKGGTAIGSQNFVQVDENPPDDDTSYVISPTIGNIDRYLYPPIVPTTGTPYAVVVWNRARKDDAGVRSIRAAIKSGATVSDSGTDQPLSTSYQYLMGLFETDPNTAVAWTMVNIQAAEFGVKVTA
jgi:hypothetical protein